jgi:hypothetical protein
MNGIFGVQKSGHKRVIGAFLTLGCSGWFGFRTDGYSFVPGQKTGSGQKSCQHFGNEKDLQKLKSLIPHFKVGNKSLVVFLTRAGCLFVTSNGFFPCHCMRKPSKTKFLAVILWPGTPVNWPGRFPLCYTSDFFAWGKVRT